MKSQRDTHTQAHNLNFHTHLSELGVSFRSHRVQVHLYKEGFFFHCLMFVAPDIMLSFSDSHHNMNEIIKQLFSS